MRKRAIILLLVFAFSLVPSLAIPATPALALEVWVSPDSCYSQTGSGTKSQLAWAPTSSIIDGNTSTRAITGAGVGFGDWTEFAVFPIEPIYCRYVRFWGGGMACAKANLDVYWDGAWHDVWDTGVSPDRFQVVDLGANYLVSNARMKFGQGTPYRIAQFYEFQYLKALPTVTTAVPDYDSDAGTATLNGNITLLGDYATVYGFFQWGSTPALGTNTAEQEITEVGAYHQDLTAVGHGTYYYRAALRYDGYYTYGTTKAWSFVKPTILSSSASSIGSDNATLNGNLSSLGDYTVAHVRFDWGEGVYNQSTSEQTFYSHTTFDTVIDGLDAGTDYQFRARVRYGLDEVDYGSKKTFTTLSVAPSGAVATAGSGEITLTWTIGEGAAETVIQRGTTGYPTSANESGCGWNVYQGDGSFYVDQDLSAGVDYYYSLWSLTGGDYSGTYTTASTTPNAPPGRCEYYNVGGNTSYHVYGNNWGAQVFTVTWQHNIESVKLLMYRNGNPGSLNIALYLLDPNGRPMGNAITYGLLSANYITELTCGNYYGVTFEGIELEAGQEIGIIFSAPSGDVDNYVGVLYNPAGGYDGGISLTSDDAGFSWTKTPDYDFMFETYSEFLLSILDAKVYTEYIEPGDWLVTFSYQNLFRPSGIPGEYFDIQLLDNGVLLSQGKLPAWGYRPGSIYLCADEADAWSWGRGYQIRMVSRFVDAEGERLIADYTLLRADWTGKDMTVLDKWVLNKANAIGEFYTYDIPVALDADDEIVYDTIETKLTGFTGGVLGLGAVEKLNEQGAAIFLMGIPMLDYQRPHLFLDPSIEATPEVTEFTHAGDALNWEVILGADTVDATAALGFVLGIEAKQTAQIGLFIIFLIVACSLAAAGFGMAGLGVGVPVTLIGVVTGIYPVAMLMVAASIVVAIVVYLIWFRGIA